MAKDAQPDEVRKVGVLLEVLQDDIQKILEVVSSQQESIGKIPKLAERMEKVEYNVTGIKLATAGTNNDLRLIKIRTEKLEEITDKVSEHEKRLTHIETS